MVSSAGEKLGYRQNDQVQQSVVCLLEISSETVKYGVPFSFWFVLRELGHNTSFQAD